MLRKEAGCTTELDYTEQSSWLLFLKYPTGLEAIAHRSPADILAEIAALDAESAEVLASIKRLP